MSGHRTTTSRGATLRRRLISVPSLVLGAIVLLVTIPIWLPLALVVDAIRAPRRLPHARLLTFAVCWAWLEATGLAVAFVLWCTRRGHRLEPHFRLQRWWARNLVALLRRTCGLVIEAEGLDALTPGSAIVFVRHASLADALLSAWLVTERAGLRPRYVLKRELLADPCLDVVGNRLPDYFVDRTATDSAPELAALERLTHGLGPGEAGVIFPEGTRANPAKRERAFESIAARDPERADRLRALRVLLPPRPAGSAAMLAGAPDADVVVVWHVGFDGLDTFGGILRRIPLHDSPARFVARRIARAEVPEGDAFTTWLDTTWLALDAEVSAALDARAAASTPPSRS
jgi:1-acyl-sn-glycerol-3-phosphate acyltransferase